MSPDRHLLFGLLALQNGFISRDQLVAAFGGWTADKGRSLDQILIEQRALAAPQRDLLIALTAAHLAQHHDDPQQSLAALSSVDDARLALTQIQDADVQASLHNLATLPPREKEKFGSTISPAGSAPSPVADSASNRRFRVLRPHARGGLGEVFLAVDTELNREVALKEIQARFADDQLNRDRFVREAEITGGLEHPAIVPVYGLGTYADGRPFYAMKFIRGDSLKEAIEAYHKPGGTAGEKSLALRQLLQRFIDICEAMQYAHDRGVLHRDLKPGNIMLGRYGETLVVDWGLAKPLGKTDEHSDESTLIPASSGSGETLPGSVVGTPAYMSPEQAGGKIEHLGPASDIYSLGATLYHLLTGMPPFVGNAADVLTAVVAGKFPKPREKNSQVTKALEAICLKAMSLKPTERYRTAKALAEDVEHWLADEPVSVLPDTFSDKFARTGRKHRGAVTAILAASVMIALSSTIAALLVNHQRYVNAELAKEKDRLAMQERQQWEKSEELALENKRLAQSAEERRIKAEILAKTEQKQRQVSEHLASENKKLADQEQRQREKAEKLAEKNAEIAHEKTEFANNLAKELQRANAAEEQAQRELYVAQLTRAASELHAGDHAAAAQTLTSVPRGRRGWEYYYLWRQCEGTPLTLYDLDGVPNSVSFSPDGSRLASSGSETILWDVRTGARLRAFAGRTSSISFSPDGTQLATGSEDGTVKLWDTRTGEMLQLLEGHTKGVHFIRFSPDGDRLASTSWDETVQLWDLKSKAKARLLRGHDGVVSSLDFSPDGLRLVSSGQREVKIWNVVTGLEVKSIVDLVGYVSAVKFSPEGTKIAAASSAEIRIFDANSGTRLQTLFSENEIHNALCFSPDGRRLASGNWNKTVTIWDVHTGKEVRKFLGHNFGSILSLDFSPDGTRLASGSEDGTIKIWDMQTEGEWLAGHKNWVVSVSFNPEGTRLVSGSFDGSLKVWDALAGTELITLRGSNFTPRYVTYSHDGTRIAAGYSNYVAGEGGKLREVGEVIIWNAETGDKVLTLPGYQGHHGFDYSSDGKYLAIASGADIIKVWDVKSEEVSQSIRHDHLNIQHVLFGQDENQLITEGSDLKIKLWDIRAGKESSMISLKIGLNALSINQDRSTLAGALGDGSIGLWNMKLGDQIQTARAHRGGFSAISFSSNGFRMASCGEDKSIKVWDTKNWTEWLTLHESSKMSSLAFSTDGMRLAVGSHDGTIKIMDARHATEVQKIRGHVDRPASIQFSRDGKLAVGRDYKGETFVWSMPEGTLLRDEPLPDATQLTHRSPEPLVNAIRRYDDILLSCKNPDYDPWVEDVERRKKLSSKWHADDAATAEQSQNHYAAAFHLGWLRRGQPDDAGLQARYDRAFTGLKKQNIAPPKRPSREPREGEQVPAKE